MNNLLNNAKYYYSRKKEEKSLENNFKSKHPFEKRLEESTRITEKYPDRIPVICERITIDIPEIDRKKFLCPMIFL